MTSPAIQALPQLKAQGEKRKHLSVRGSGPLNQHPGLSLGETMKTARVDNAKGRVSGLNLNPEEEYIVKGAGYIVIEELKLMCRNDGRFFETCATDCEIKFQRFLMAEIRAHAIQSRR